MGSVEFTIYMLVALYGLFAIAVWFDEESMHKADREDIHHMHMHN